VWSFFISFRCSLPELEQFWILANEVPVGEIAIGRIAIRPYVSQGYRQQPLAACSQLPESSAEKHASICANPYVLCKAILKQIKEGCTQLWQQLS
jgi:hypothetical protein